MIDPAKDYTLGALNVATGIIRDLERELAAEKDHSTQLRGRIQDLEDSLRASAIREQAYERIVRVLAEEEVRED